MVTVSTLGLEQHRNACSRNLEHVQPVHPTGGFYVMSELRKSEDRSCRQSLATALMSGSQSPSCNDTGHRLIQVVPLASVHVRTSGTACGNFEDVRECQEFFQATVHVSASCDIRDMDTGLFLY